MTGALARIEVRHLARSPLLWLGFALGMAFATLNMVPWSSWPVLSRDDKHRHDPAGDHDSVVARRDPHHPQGPPEEQRVEEDDEGRAEETEALTDYGEDEVGVPLGQEEELGLGGVVSPA